MIAELWSTRSSAACMECKLSWWGMNCHWNHGNHAHFCLAVAVRLAMSMSVGLAMGMAVGLAMGMTVGCLRLSCRNNRNSVDLQQAGWLAHSGCSACHYFNLCYKQCQHSQSHSSSILYLVGASGLSWRYMSFALVKCPLSTVNVIINTAITTGDKFPKNNLLLYTICGLLTIAETLLLGSQWSNRY